jgi:O-antigen ligase
MDGAEPHDTSPKSVFLLGQVAGLALIACLLAYWFLQPVPTTFKAVTAVLVILALLRPAWGLLGFAAIAPVSTAFANFCGAPGMGAQFLAQVALAVGAGVLLRSRALDGRTRIGGPALFMAVVALASAAAMLPAATAPIARSVWDGLVLHQLAIRQTAATSPTWVPAFAALVIAECALLGWAVERTVRREPQLAARLVVVALIGHAGAAALNLQTVLGQALRTGDTLEALPRLLMTARLSMQTDWNAGASALLLAGVAGLGLMGMPWWRRAGVGVLLAIVATGLWITGSRIAMAMGIGAVVAAIGWSTVGAAWRRRLMAAGAVVVVLGLGAWVVVYNPSGRSAPLPGSITLRWVMAKAGVQMFREAPVFGIGITKFYDASTTFAGEYLTSVGWRPRENAHNNFIQVLAELGLAGFIALMWWLGTLLVPAARAQIAKPDALRRSLLLAIVACVGTWITGHPLLVPEFAFVFWLYCGILAALTPAALSLRPRWPLALLVAVVLATVPWRASALRDAADLEHLGFGVSKLWQQDDSQRYREAGSDFALYLPVGDRPVDLPFRLAPGAHQPLVMEIRIQGELIDSIPIGDTAWQTATIAVRPGPRRFEIVDFAIRSPTAGTDLPAVLLRVGKDVAR